MPPAQNLYEYDPMGQHLVEGDEDELELCKLLRQVINIELAWLGTGANRTDSPSEGSSEETDSLAWIVSLVARSGTNPQTWFTTHIPGHDYFCEVHEDFIEDDFNLTGR